MFSVITDRERKVKISMGGKHLLATLAIGDPQVTVSMPRGVTASTGVDALTHAIESFNNNVENPFTDNLLFRPSRPSFPIYPRSCAVPLTSFLGPRCFTGVWSRESV